MKPRPLLRPNGAATRNLVSPDTAARNRETPGGFTFNAEVPNDYEGLILVIAALRLGDHAHLDVHSGRQVPPPPPLDGRPTRHLGRAGKLILPWHQWEGLRDLLDSVDAPVVLREVENPTKGNLENHV